MPNLATIRDAALRVGCSQKTIRRRLADGDLTPHRLGPRVIRVDLDELEAVLQPAAPEARIADYISRTVASAPPLTQEQCAHLVGLIHASAVGGSDAA